MAGGGRGRPPGRPRRRESPEEVTLLGSRDRAHLVPGAAPFLERLKYEVAAELGGQPGRPLSREAFEAFLDQRKLQVAAELGLLDRIDAVGWPNMTSRECGLVGGRLGGRIGGRMVRRMVEWAQRNME